MFFILFHYNIQVDTIIISGTKIHTKIKYKDSDKKNTRIKIKNSLIYKD